METVEKQSGTTFSKYYVIIYFGSLGDQSQFFSPLFGPPSRGGVHVPDPDFRVSLVNCFH